MLEVDDRGDRAASTRGAPTPIGADDEVRAFCPGLGIDEDPVTGSLNAGLRGVADPRRAPAARRTSRARAPRWAATDACRSAPTTSGDVWVGGASRTVVSGTVDL